MPDLPIAGVQLVAETDGYTNEINKVIAQAGQVDAALADVVAAANQTEGALNAIDTSVDIEVAADTAAALADIGKLDALTPTVDITAALDDAQALTDIGDLDAKTADVDVTTTLDDATARAGIADLDAKTADVDVLAALDDAAALAGINTLDELSPSVDITTDLEQADLLTLESLAGQTYTPDIKPELDDAPIKRVEDLDSATVDPNIRPNLSDDAPIKRVEDLDSETVTPKIDAQETESSDAILDRLDNLRNMQAIELALNFTGPGLGVLEKAYSLLTENQDAVAMLEARTAESIPNVGKLIDEVLINSLATSRGEIAQTVAVADQLGITGDVLQPAVEGAIDFAAIWDEDVNGTLKAARQLVITGLAPDFQTAFDLLQSGMEQGLNKSGDFLDVINEFSAPMAALGLTGEQAFGLWKSGLDSGFDSLSRVADATKELQIRVTDTGNQDARTALRSLGLPIPKDVEDMGAEYVSAIIEGIRKKAETNPQQATNLARTLFGSFAEDFGTSVITGLDPVDATFTNIENRARDAKDVFDNTLGQTVQTFFETVESKASEFLSSDQLGLGKKIEEIRTGLEDAMDVLQGGGTLGEALEVGLKIQGVDEFIANFQRVVGNFTIGLLEMIASVQEFLGRDASGTRGEIAKLAEGQLAFDLKIANPDEVSGLIQQAVDRGVDTGKLQTLVEASTRELIDAGEVDRAQKMLDALTQMGGSAYVLADGLDEVQRAMAQTLLDKLASGEISPEDFAAGAAQMPEVFIPVGVDTSGLQEEVGVAAELVRQEATRTLESGDFDMARILFGRLGDEEMVAQIDKTVGDLETAFNDAMAAGDFNAAKAAAESLGDEEKMRQVTDAMGAVEESATSMSNTVRDQLALANQNILDFGEGTELVLTGNTVTEDFLAVAEAAEDAFPRVISSADEVYEAILRWEGLNSILATVSEQFNVFVGSAQAAALAASTAASQIAGALASVGENQGKINEAQAAADQDTKHYAGGGTPALHEPVWVGEAGPELAVFDREAAVLNRATSQAIMQAVSGAAGRSVTTTNRTQNVTIINNNTVQSQAQADAIGYRVARDIRGM